MWSYDIPPRYRLIEHLGEHPGSAVWQAEDLERGCPVAMVFVEPVLWEPKRVSRFIRLMGQLSLIEHPNVVTVLDHGETDIGRGFAALELLQGSTIEQLIEQSQVVMLGELLTIAVEVLGGLAALHDRALVHGDIEPDNLFLTLDGDHIRPKLIGIGHGRAVERAIGRASIQSRDSALEEENAHDGGEGSQSSDLSAQAEMTSSVDEAHQAGYLRSLAFSSPEQAKGTVSIDSRSDLYSLAAVLYEMISGRLPHPGTTDTELRTAIINGEALPLESICQKVPLVLSKVIQRSMAFYLSARTSDARTMQRELLEALRGIPPSILAEPLPLQSERTDGPDGLPSTSATRSGKTGRTLRIVDSSLSGSFEPSGVEPLGRAEDEAQQAEPIDEISQPREESSDEVGGLGDITEEVTIPRSSDVVEGMNPSEDMTIPRSSDVVEGMNPSEDMTIPRSSDVVEHGDPSEEVTTVSGPCAIAGGLKVAAFVESSHLEMDPTTVYDRQARGTDVFEAPKVPTTSKRWVLLAVFAGAVLISMIVGGLIALLQSGGASIQERGVQLPASQIPLVTGAVDAGGADAFHDAMVFDFSSFTDAATGVDSATDAETATSRAVDADAIRSTQSMVRWTLVGVPEGSLLRLDEQDVEGFTIEVAQDGRVHLVEVVAPGFARWSRRLSARRNMEISVSMRPTRRYGRGAADKTIPRGRQPTKIDPEVVRNPGF